jgi:acetate---CoA ligase (ADP-forming)
MGQHGVASALVSSSEIIVPSFTFPEASAIAIAKACEYGEWLQKPKGVIPNLSGIDKNKALSIIKTAKKKDPARPLWLDAESVNALLKCYGVNTVPSRVAASAEEAARVSADLGYPVALKLFSRTITHKTEVGGVILNLTSGEQVKAAFRKMKEGLEAMGKGGEMQGVTIQPMIATGTEMIVGVTQDPSFGPLMLFGMGGVYTELFKDVSMRIHPLTDIDAGEMVRSVKAYQLLEGWRGSKKQDIASLEELLLRISAMIEDIEEVRELDLTPVRVQEAGKGYVVLDARILVA